MRDGNLDFIVARLGESRFPSPLSGVRFTRDHERVLHHSQLEDIKSYIAGGDDPPTMEAAGPREKLFFDRSQLFCGIVTCGGLCPGLNDAIRAVVLSLYHQGGVNDVHGFRFGYEGLRRGIGHQPLKPTPETVNRIHENGATILGFSRGPQDPAEIAKTLAELKIDILFTSLSIVFGMPILLSAIPCLFASSAIVCAPRSVPSPPIVSFVRKTFGFETAVDERRAIYAANNTKRLASKSPSSTLISAIRSVAGRQIHRTRPFALSSDTAPCIQGGTKWWSDSGIINSPSCPFLWPCHSAKRSTRRGRSGTVLLPLPANHGTALIEKAGL